MEVYVVFLNKGWQEMQFKNSRGLTLAGLLYSPVGHSGPVVIVCHGFTGSKEGEGSAITMGEELGDRGYNTLLFDFSGNGDSEGLFENITLSGQVDDLRSAVDWCVGTGMGPVFTMGRSFGGTTVICHGAVDSRVAGVCTWAAPARLMELFTEFAEGPVDDEGDLFVLAGEEGIAYLRKAFFDNLDRFDIPALAGRISPRPLLVIQGEKDDVVNPADAGLIFNGAKEPKEILYISGADHQFSQHHRQVWDACFAWLKRYITV
ncbi:MAG TPA: alpha/beta hydrolase [Desulfotomaculum sp.]|nr:MAG: hydrolase [Desulfotomaculum sp. BICA1-6]HBX24234.1 alpha/beta hydrolase [Desulfotomaculum sp.]